MKPFYRLVFLKLQLVELKEAEQKSLKESERLEKEIADVQELKVIITGRKIGRLDNGYHIRVKASELVGSLKLFSLIKNKKIKNQNMIILFIWETCIKKFY